MSDETAISDVSDTAFWVAHYRGIESARKKPLFHDPLSARLAGERGRNIAEGMPHANIVSWMAAVRTVVIDRFIATAISEGVDTVLNLGAGLDTRPYRMSLPPTLTWIEADQSSIIDYKSALLKNETPHCTLSRVKVDLSNAEARRSFLSAAAANAKKILVLTEGVILYLDESDVADLAQDLRPIADFWIIDYVSPFERSFRPKVVTEKLKRAPLKFHPADWWGFFEAQGWRRREFRYLSEEGDARGRRIDFPLFKRLTLFARAMFMAPERRAAFRSMMGYALMEPVLKAQAHESTKTGETLAVSRV
jgi:methyltransferase (TIGR00027 family)